MAKQKSESKAPLVVALAFFVLTTIALGIMVYMAYDEKAQILEAASASEKKAKEAEKLRSIDQERVYVYQTLLGINTADQFDGLKNARNTAEVKKEFNAITTEMGTKLQAVLTNAQQQVVADKNAAGITDPVRVAVTPTDIFQWNWTGDVPNTEPQMSVLQGLVRAVAKEQLAIAKQKQDQAQLAAAVQNYDAQQKLTKAAEDNFKAQAQAFPTEVKKIKDDSAAALQQSRKDYAKDTLDFTKKVEELKLQFQKKEIQANDLERALAGLNEVRAKLEAKLELKQDPFEFDKPHGKITNRNGSIVTINLGSAQNVHPGLTFSVQPANTPEVGLQTRMRERRNPRTGQAVVKYYGSDNVPVYEMEIIPKGLIEVTEVLGPSVSLARITSQSDQLRDSILAGDVLYNAAWRPGNSDHVALLGLFDTDGDGVDDTRRVVRDLQRMGITVDAYFDLEKRAWEGKVSERTIFTVEGYYPEQIGGDETLTAAKGALYDAMQKARREAKDKGARIVKMRDFFPRIGYNVKLDVSPDRVNQAYLKYLAAPVAADPNAGM